MKDTLCDVYSGRNIAVSGYDKASGKTSFLSYASHIARKSGPVGLFTIGIDGQAKQRVNQGSCGSTDALFCEVGDLVLTSASFLKSGTAQLEVLEVFATSGTFGKPLLARVKREGSITLSGGENPRLIAQAAALARNEFGIKTLFIDGAVNRITQLASFTDFDFVFTVRADVVNLKSACERIRFLYFVSKLESCSNLSDFYYLNDALTESVFDSIVKSEKSIVIDDFTKLFIDTQKILRLKEKVGLFVKNQFRIFRFVVVLKDLSKKAFLQELQLSEIESLILFNPYEEMSNACN